MNVCTESWWVITDVLVINQLAIPQISFQHLLNYIYQVWLLLMLSCLTQAEAQSQKQQEQLERLRKDMGAVPMETAAPTGTFIQNGHVSFIKGVI